MQTVDFLKPGDWVEIIAPASRCSDEQLAASKALLESWGLQCVVAADIFGSDLLCAHTDTMRFQHLANALYNPLTKAIFCARGGYGCSRLMPALAELEPPPKAKWLIGMSDITAVMLYLQQAWQWPTLHGSILPDKYSLDSIQQVKKLLFGELNAAQFNHLRPLNAAAHAPKQIQAKLIGGNLCLIQAGIGTLWQMQSAEHIVFIEEIDERGYRVDRMLMHFEQAGLLKDARAIILGDFIQGEEPNGSTLIPAVLQRFADSLSIPVMQLSGVGHDFINYPLPLGTMATLQLGEEGSLTVNLT